MARREETESQGDDDWITGHAALMKMPLNALALAPGGARREGPDDSAGAVSLLDWKRRRWMMMNDEQQIFRAQVPPPPTGGKGWQPSNSHPANSQTGITGITADTEDDVLWTVKDAAVFLGVSERKVWNKIRERGGPYEKIPVVRLDGKPRFVPSQVREWKRVYGHRLRKLTPAEEMRVFRTTMQTLRKECQF